MDYTQQNAKMIDDWVEKGWEWGVPISHEVYINAQNGKWDVLLTPTKPVPHEWFSPFLKDGNFLGARLLGLASGGGQQMPVFAALKADCTVLDFSDRQLDNERMVARREGYEIDVVKGDMAKKLPFPDENFDVIFHPVANSYVEDVYHVWNECFRVLKRGGILLSGMDNGFNFLFDDDSRPRVIKNRLPFNPLRNPDQYKKLSESGDGFQFSHTLEEQIGGQLKAGFVLTDVYEDFNSDPQSIADGIPAFWATRSRKPL